MRNIHHTLVFCVTDMTFTHEGNKTYYFDRLVNFEKMVRISKTAQQWCAVLGLLDTH